MFAVEGSAECDRLISRRARLSAAKWNRGGQLRPARSRLACQLDTQFAGRVAEALCFGSADNRRRNALGELPRKRRLGAVR